MTQPPTPEALTYAVKGLGYELDGVIIDTEEGGGFDAICLKTVKRVRAALAALASQSRPAAPSPNLAQDARTALQLVSARGDRYWRKVDRLLEQLAARPAADEASERERFEAAAKRHGWTPGDFMLGTYAGWLAAKADMSTPAPQIDASAGCVDSSGWHEPWRVGEFVSSARRPEHVLMLAVGEKRIAEYGAHRDFVRWVYPPAESTDGLTKGDTSLHEAARAVITARDNFGWSADTDAAIERLRGELASKTQEG